MCVCVIVYRRCKFTLRHLSLLYLNQVQARVSWNPMIITYENLIGG